MTEMVSNMNWYDWIGLKYDRIVYWYKGIGIQDEWLWLNLSPIWLHITELVSSIPENYDCVMIDDQ